jgi:hypothetical protein
LIKFIYPTNSFLCAFSYLTAAFLTKKQSAESRMKKYIPGKRSANSKQKIAKTRIKSEQEKASPVNKMYHKPDWVIRENFD